MKTILLLGGFGFLGTNVLKFVDLYRPHDYRFIVFDKFCTHPYGVSFNCINRIYSGDFTDTDLLEQVFQDNQIDIVIHSLSSTVPANSSNAIFDVESNLIPTLHLLRLMTKYQVQDIVYLSSGGAIYGKQTGMPHKESDNPFPISSYGVVKLAIEKYLMQYAELYGIRPLILRLSNPYGPYHYSMRQGVINVAIAKALKDETFTVWGNGDGRKDYIYVEDYVCILLELIDRGIHNKVLNVASNQLLSVQDIIDEIRLFIPDFKTENQEASLFDAEQFELNTAELSIILPDFHFTPFKDGFLKTLNWTKSLC